MDKLPQQINSLLAPLESDSIDDEEVQEKLLKSVLDITQIFRAAAAENLLRFEDPAQHRSSEADGGKKRKRVDKRDVIRAQFVKEQFKSFVSIMMEWLTLPSSTYVEVQVVGLNALLDMVKRFEADNIFDNSLFARTMRVLIRSSNCSAELVVTFLQEYAKKYGDVAYFALKGMRVVVMDTVASYEDKKTSEVKAAIVARNVYNVVSRMQIPMDEESLLRSFVGARAVLGEDEDNEAESEDDLSSSEEADENGDDESDDGEDDGDNSDASTAEKSVKRPKWAAISFHRREYSKLWCGLLRLPLSDKMYRAILRKLPNEIIPNMVNPILISDFITTSCDQGGEAGLLALSGMYQLIAKYNFDYPSFYNKIYAMITPDLFYAKYRSNFFEKLSLFMTSSRMPLTTVASFSKRLARLSLHGPPSGALFALPLIFNMLKRHPKCISMIHRESKTPNGSNSDDDNNNINTTKDPFKSDENDPAKTNAINSSLWEIEALQKHPNPSVSTLAKSFNQSFSKRPYNMKNFCSSTYKDMFDRQIHRRINKEPAVNFQEPEGLFADSKYFTTSFAL